MHARYSPFEMDASYALYLFCSKRGFKSKSNIFDAHRNIGSGHENNSI